MLKLYFSIQITLLSTNIGIGKKDAVCIMKIQLCMYLKVMYALDPMEISIISSSNTTNCVDEQCYDYLIKPYRKRV